MVTDLSNSHELLMACVRQSFSNGESQPISVGKAAPGYDWTSFTELASVHGLMPLVHSTLISSDIPAPGSVIERFQAEYLAQRMRLEYSAEPVLRETLHSLWNLGLKPIILKGPALAYTAYSDPSHRLFADLDLLLRDDELCRAHAALQQLGFRTREVQPELRRLHQAPPNHHLEPLQAPCGQLEVELHRHLIPEPQPYSIELDQLRDRSVVADIAHTEAHVLAATDELFVACLHLAYSHRYRRLPLRNLTDILAISLGRAGMVDWDQFVDTVLRSRAAGAAYWPLWLARTWLDAPVPERVLSRLAPPAGLRRVLGAFIDPRYILNDDVPEDVEIAYRLLIRASLHSGCGTRELLRATIEGLVAADASSTRGTRLTPSFLQPATYLIHPKRVSRGLRCCARLAQRFSRR